jgi:hypothetical protein
MLGAYSVYSQGQAAQAAYEAQANEYEKQAQIAGNNKVIAENQASQTLEQGAGEERRFRLRAAQFLEGQHASLAASGGTMSGSALSVLADTAMGIEEDVQTMRLNKLLERWGFQVEAVNYKNQADSFMASAANARASGASAKKAAKFGAFTTLLGGAVNAWGASPLSASAANGSISVSSAPVYATLGPQAGGSLTDSWWKPGRYGLG